MIDVSRALFGVADKTGLCDVSCDLMITCTGMTPAAPVDFSCLSSFDLPLLFAVSIEAPPTDDEFDWLSERTMGDDDVDLLRFHSSFSISSISMILLLSLGDFAWSDPMSIASDDFGFSKWWFSSTGMG